MPSPESFALNSMIKISVAILFGMFIWHIYHAVGCIAYPYTIDTGGEGFILNQAYLLNLGYQPYCDISVPPYIVASYPPIYPSLCAGIIYLSGPTYVVGRTISFLSTLLTAVLIYKITREASRSGVLAAFASLLFLSSGPVLYWGHLFRVDSLGLMFSIVGIYLIFRHNESKKLFLSIPFFLLALYTKQLLIAAPIATLIFLSIQDWRLALKYGTILALIGGLVFMGINLATGGQFFQHIFTYNIQSYSLGRTISAYSTIFLTHILPIGIAGAFVAYSFSSKKRTIDLLRTKTSLIVIYFITAAITALSVGQIGSNVNHFLELLAVSCILMGIGLSRIIPFIGNRRTVLAAATILLTFQLVVLLAINMRIFDESPSEKDMADSKQISSYIRNANGAVLAEDGGLLVLNDKDVMFEPFVFTQLSNGGLWDQTSFLCELSNREFSLVVLSFNVSDEDAASQTERFTDDMIEQIRDNYYLVDRVGDTYIYK